MATGQRIASVAAPRMKHLHLELGGKDAFVIAPDADVASAADALAEKVSTLRLGPGIDASTDMGPLINEATRSKVERHVADAVSQGATIVAGGRRPEAHQRGFFYEPAVLTGVDNDMTIMQEETFGPTIPVMGYRDFGDAIRWVNDHAMGLGATLRSPDPALCKRFFDEVKAGTVWINDPLTDNYAGPSVA